MLSLECIELGKSGIELSLKGVDLVENCVQLVVVLANTDRAKNGIPVGVSEGKDGARAVADDVKARSGARQNVEKPSGERRCDDQGEKEAHLQGVRQVHDKTVMHDVALM